METVQHLERPWASSIFGDFPRPPGAVVANPKSGTESSRLADRWGQAVHQAAGRAARANGALVDSRHGPGPRASIASIGSNRNSPRPIAAVEGESVVYVVDGDNAARESLEALIRLAGWRCEVCASAAELLSRPVIGPGCLVMDYGLAGLDLQNILTGRWSDVAVIFVTGYADVRAAVEAMKRGAADFLTKPCDGGLLLEAIQNALASSRANFDKARTVRAMRERHETLSRREHEVMRLVVAGLLNKQIGFELGISEITVKAHRGQAMRKMGARSVAGLVTMAGQIGLPMAPTA